MYIKVYADNNDFPMFINAKAIEKLWLTNEERDVRKYILNLTTANGYYEIQKMYIIKEINGDLLLYDEETFNEIIISDKQAHEYIEFMTTKLK